MSKDMKHFLTSVVGAIIIAGIIYLFGLWMNSIYDKPTSYITPIETYCDCINVEYID